MQQAMQEQQLLMQQEMQSFMQQQVQLQQMQQQLHQHQPAWQPPVAAELDPARQPVDEEDYDFGDAPVVEDR